PIGGVGSAPIANLKPLNDGRTVIDLFAVNVLRFAADIKREPVEWTGRFTSALIFADPKGRDAYWPFSDIAGTIAEGETVRKTSGGELLVGEAATVREFMKKGENVDLIYFASHAISDSKDPLRQSYIALADGGLTADMIKRSNLKARLVV